jgi:S-adenosylmethionine:tRNA ribosyltransferase-isomerase
MKTSDFDYELPESAIAQTPVEPRDSSRLLVLHRESGRLEHRIFSEIGGYFRPADLLVLNQTRVIPGRLFARKATGGRVELLLLRRLDPMTWDALIGGKGMTEHRHAQVEGGPGFEVLEVLDGAERRIRFDRAIDPYLPKLGHVPLPPYIHADLQDPERYQTVYARDPGSAAAPTAGLHFTPQLLDALKAQGVKIASVTLHVGLDTFAPVTEDDPAGHVIHREWCQLPQEAAAAIRKTRANGGRIVAVGTTSVRTLESAAQASKLEDRGADVRAFSGDTDLFILPGHPFRLVMP